MQTGERARNQQEEPATTGAISAKGKISDEQRTEIRNTIVETHVDPVAHVDFDINIGVAVPSTVVLYPLPPRIVEIVPAYASYQYFVLADGTILIVDPGTLQIVYVIA